jgi:hypothetical protein
MTVTSSSDLTLTNFQLSSEEEETVHFQSVEDVVESSGPKTLGGPMAFTDEATFSWALF